jgi:hypothetical protein
LNGKRRWYFGKFFLGFSTNQLGNYSLTVTDLSISGCSSDPVAFTVEEIFHLHLSPIQRRLVY